MEVANRQPAAFGIFARFERLTHPARGRAGGGPGATGRLSLGSGVALKGKGFQVVPAGDRLVVEMPGGGGFGDPFGRDPDLVARDVRYGLLEPEQAAQYGVAVSADGVVDQAETERLRRPRPAER
jgi:N-methylhydantoinase B